MVSGNTYCDTTYATVFGRLKVYVPRHSKRELTFAIDLLIFSYMSAEQVAGSGKERDFKQELFETLRALMPELAESIVIHAFRLNPDGTVDPATEEALKAIRQRDGYSLYEEVITNLDTEYARTQYSAGQHRRAITDPYLLAHVPDAAELHQLNMISIQHNELAIDDHTFGEAIVAQAPSEAIDKLGEWPLSPHAIVIK